MGRGVNGAPPPGTRDGRTSTLRCRSEAPGRNRGRIREQTESIRDVMVKRARCQLCQASPSRVAPDDLASLSRLPICAAASSVVAYSRT
jgi:hypothetical protein